MKTKTWLSGLFVSLSICTLLGSANAAIVQYNDRSSFLSDTGATSATGALPSLGSVGPSATVGSVTFTQGPGASALIIGSFGSVTDWTPTNPGNDIALSASEDLDVDFAAPVFAAGFDFVEPNQDSPRPGCNAPCFDSDFEVTLLLGATAVDVFNFNAPDNVLAFVGVWSDSAFDRLEIRDLNGEIDNEYYGEFYTGLRPLSEVPVPAAVWLFGSALLGLMGIRRRAPAA